MAFTFGQVRKSLRIKGFTEDSARHHIFLRLMFEGKHTHIYTKCSHGADKDDVGHGLVTAMRKQLELETKRQVEDLVNCPMTQEEYIQTLLDSGKLPPKNNR